MPLRLLVSKLPDTLIVLSVQLAANPSAEKTVKNNYADVIIEPPLLVIAVYKKDLPLFTAQLFLKVSQKPVFFLI